VEFFGIGLAMSVSTKIQWCDSTVNPTMGCDGCELWKPSAGVKKCYAGVLHARFGSATNKGYSPVFEQLTFYPGRMTEAAKWSDLTGKPRIEKPWLDGLPRIIFVSDMSDALSAAVPFDFLSKEVIGNVTSNEGRRHHWLWLTKRPIRMARFSAYLSECGIDWPTNLWAGTSITSQKSVARLKYLMNVGDENTIRFLSVEPQFAPIEFGDDLAAVDWVIQGGESGAGARPFQLEWAVDLGKRCKDNGVPFFLKQLGASPLFREKPLSLDDGHGGDWSQWPKSVRIRQMPTLAS
jgi:protein gp37